MSDLVERLRAWGPMVSSGYECPAAGTVMHEAADRIEQLEAENASLATWQCEFTDGKTGLVYGQGGTTFCIMAKRMQQLEAEVKVWQGHAKTAIWSDSEECKMLTRINAALLEAPTVDVDVVVPDRDYSAMTPKDCYEAGLLDGVYQAREAIKAAARAALDYREMDVHSIGHEDGLCPRERT